MLFVLFLMVSPIIMLATGGAQTPMNNMMPQHSVAGLVQAVSAGRQRLLASQARIAVVKPVFTATAYSSFYDFYSTHARTPNGTFVKDDIGLLNTSVVDSWGWSNGLYSFLSSGTANQYGLVMGKNLRILTDINVTEGALFKSDGSSNFDVLVLGFTEYVTVQEYLAYKHFVAAGGTIIFMDAANFLAEVRYYPQTHHLALVRGHSWGFDGVKAWRDQFARWGTENTNWIGSNYCSFGMGKRYNGAVLAGDNPIALALRERFGPKVFASYGGHEENCVTNMTDTVILARWSQLSPDSKSVVAYLHHYLNGSVVHIGVMSSDVISSDTSVQQFLIASILFAANTRG